MEFTEDQVAAFLEVIKDAGYEPYAYSGRYMYGADCVGVTLTDADAFVFVGDIVECAAYTNYGIAPEELAKMIRNARTDSMGLSEVIYFPALTWLEDNAAS